MVANSRPVGSTKGLPWMSSRSPGCSPTIISHARAGPSPGTTYVLCL
ncbi:MAG: hypothetical protein P8Y53_11225 [Pseudolabrys sp.]